MYKSVLLVGGVVLMIMGVLTGFIDRSIVAPFTAAGLAVFWIGLAVKP